MEEITVEERGEAAGRPKPAVESQPQQPRQRHPAMLAEDTPFNIIKHQTLFIATGDKSIITSD